MRVTKTTSIFAVVAATFSVQSAYAQTPNITAANANVLNLLAPFLNLNNTAIGQQTLQMNLSQAISINNNATLSLEQLAISDKNLLNNASNFVSNGVTNIAGKYGVAANLAGGIPDQTPPAGTTIIPHQAVGGYGTQLGAIYTTAVNSQANGGAAPLANTVALLTSAYNNLTSPDLGVAKNYFANGAATNPSTTPPGYVPVAAVAPAGFTLPTANGLPNTKDSVYDLAYGVTNTGANQNVYGSSRPAQVVAPNNPNSPLTINAFDPTALNGISTNPSFPSGHTTYAYTDSILLGMLTPSEFTGMLSRASEYANSRIVLGVHYPLDIIGSRALASYELSQAFTNPSYINNTGFTGSASSPTSINLPSLYNAANAELSSYLAAQCGAAVATCAASTANNTGNPYKDSAANLAAYTASLTYGLPTLSFSAAPREAAPTGGPDASILLASLYGGSTTAAKTIAPTGGMLGTLTTNTINQIVVNTETNALAAFYGTSLSYWARINLYAATDYFQGVTGALTLASSDIVTTNVTIANGGTLGGTGTVANTTVASGGTLQPGSGGQGTLQINGSLAFQSGALYLVQVTSSTSPSTNVTGTASLTGATVQLASANNTFKFNQPMTILTSAGLGGTTFSSLTTPTGITGTLSYTGTSVSLNTSSSLGQIAGLNANQKALGSALDSAFNAPGATTGPLGAIFSGNVAQNLTQAAGESSAGSQQSTFNAMTQFMGVMTDPTVDGRGAPAGQSGPSQFAEEEGPLGYASNGKPRSKSERDAYAAIYRKAPLRDVYDPRWSVWAAGFGGSQSTDGNATLGTNATTSRIFGGAVGADYIFSPNTIAGFALAGGGTSFSVANALGSGRSDLFQAGVFVRHTQGPAYITGALAYGWQDVTTNRTVTIAGIDQLRAQFNANAYSGRVEGGYRFVMPWMGGVGITPYAAGQFTTFDLPAYAEQVVTGLNTFAQAFAARTVTATRSELGVRSDKSWAMQDAAILTLRGRAAWAHDYNNDRTVTATFQSLPGNSFVVNGARQAPDSALVTGSAEMKWRNGFSLAATFEGEFSDVTRSYAGKGVARYSW